MLRVTTKIAVDESELDITYTRASGPGGQHVNKVSTAVQLRYNFRESPGLPQGVKQRLAARNDHRITAGGDIIIDASQFRSQRRNRDDAIRRLVEMLQQVAKPRKKRRLTRPTLGSVKRRLENKRHRSETKQRRRNVDMP